MKEQWISVVNTILDSEWYEKFTILGKSKVKKILHQFGLDTHDSIIAS